MGQLTRNPGVLKTPILMVDDVNARIRQLGEVSDNAAVQFVRKVVQGTHACSCLKCFITCRSRRASTCKSKPGKLPGVQCGSIQSAHIKHFEGFSEHGIFHGIAVYQ